MTFLDRILRRTPPPEPKPQSALEEIAERRRAQAFSTDPFTPRVPAEDIVLEHPTSDTFRTVGVVDGEVFTFDEALSDYGMDAVQLKSTFTLAQGTVPDSLFNWYAAQSFIGYQACAVVSQHYMIDKVLRIPAEDAVRNGYDIIVDDGEKLGSDELSELTRADEKYRIAENLREFEINRRRFGFRIAIYVVESDDPDYYSKPFNIDSVGPGTYKGISQVDPNWVSPVLDEQAAANPAAMDFYEPTWWQISGQLYHKSHLEVRRYVEPADVLKPAYQYGGIPLTQLILERVYAAERTANEAPMLVETKRLNIIYTDVAAVTANPGKFEDRLKLLVGFRDNYAVYVAGLEDRMEQIETALSDLDSVIMVQYQLVAAVAGMPATKLLGTTPIGFNATGEFELESYNQTLESIQDGLSGVLKHHHQLMMKSDFPDMLEDGREIVSVWNPVSTPSPKELAEINYMNAQADAILVQTGGIDGRDVRERLINDERSGYSALESFEVEPDDEARHFVDPSELENQPQLPGSAEPSNQVGAGDRGLLGYVKLMPDASDATILIDWARAAGITELEHTADLHLTLVHSVSGIADYEPLNTEYRVWINDLGLLGSDSALVFFMDSKPLRMRHNDLLNQGATTDFESFAPHITVKYGATPEDLALLQKAFKTYDLSKPITLRNETINVT